MKPCRQNRKHLAWMALGALEAERAQELRAHLEVCAGCRRYLDEISRVTEKLATADTTQEIQASESFHRRVVGRLRAEGTSASRETLVEHLLGTVLNWRVALPSMGVLALMLAVLFVLAGRRTPPLAESPAAPGVMAAIPTKEVPPSLSNYRIAASQSFEKLDELLTRQGNRAGWAGPVYTAGMLGAE